MRLGARSWQNISECVRSALLNLYDNAIRLEDIQNSFSETQARESERRNSLENRTQSEHSFGGGNCAIPRLLTLSFTLPSTESELETQFLALAGDSSALTDVLRDHGQTLAGLNDAWIYQKKKDIANNRLGLSHGGAIDEEKDISLLISRFEDENQELLSELGEARREVRTLPLRQLRPLSPALLSQALGVLLAPLSRVLARRLPLGSTTPR